jgi:hypothetical protein
MLPNQASHDFFVGIQGTNGPFLIFPHETAVAFDIGTEDGSEFTFNFLVGHGVSPKNSIKGREKIKLFRRFFTPVDKKLLFFDKNVNKN